MFAVANREIVTVSFDPFDPAQPAMALQLPLFVLIFVLVGLGVLVGGIAAWLRQHRWRVRARRAEAEARELRARLDAAARAPAARARRAAVRRAARGLTPPHGSHDPHRHRRRHRSRTDL